MREALRERTRTEPARPARSLRPAAPPPAAVAALQRSAGNRAVAGLLSGARRRQLSRTRAGDTLKGHLDAIVRELAQPQFAKLVVKGGGPGALVAEIKGIIDEGKAGYSDIVGKFRELFYGLQALREGKPVQFGLVGGAGGDVYVGGDRNETVQSKYVTAEQERTVVQNVAKAIYQLSGDTGEMPRLRSRRVADVVIEGEFGDKIVGDPGRAHKVVSEALAGEGREAYPQIDLGKHVEEVRLTSRGWRCDMPVVGGKPRLSLSVQVKAPREADFPELHLIGNASLKKLVGDHLNELGPQAPASLAPPVVPVANDKGNAPDPKGKAPDPKGNAPEAKEDTPDDAADALLKGVADPANAQAIVTFLTNHAGVVNKLDALPLLRAALASGDGEAVVAAKGILGQLARAGAAAQIDLETRMAKLLKRWRRPEEAAPVVALADKRLTGLQKHPVLVGEMQKVPAEVAWSDRDVLAAFECLVAVGKLDPRVAAEALRDVVQAPLGLPACAVIGRNHLWTHARARGYPRVLGQFHNRDERLTVLAVLLHADEMFVTEGAHALASGWIMAFEYDETSPGMWELTDKHFDMDVGWVLESWPVVVTSIRQVKLATSAEAILNNMHHSLEAGQLSLTSAGDRRLVVYCPSVARGTFQDVGGRWKMEVAKRLSSIDATGVVMQVVFSDQVATFRLDQVKAEGNEMREREDVALHGEWTVVQHGKHK